MSYCVFVRNWWRPNKAYPNGLEPCVGRKRVLAKRLTYDEARRMCEEYNRTHNPGRLSRKAEFMEN